MPLAALLIAAAAFFFHQTRGTTLYADEWIWALYRRGGALDTFIEPHNEHLSLVPIALYKLLFATAGLDHSTPYRALVIASQLLCATLVFAYAKRRVGAYLALLAATLILFFGPGWQNIFWPFQTAWLLSLAAGVGALLALDRRDRIGNAIASILLAVSLGSSGVGVALSIGVAVELLWQRRWRAGWVVAAPLVLYGLWSLRYGESTSLLSVNVEAAPGWVVEAAAPVVAGLLGLGGRSVPDETGTILEWGRPLALAAAVVLVWRLGTLKPIPPRVVALLSMVVSFWVLTALSRAGVVPPYTSRYVYVGAFLLILVAVELLRGVAVGRRASLLLGLLVCASVLGSISTLRAAGEFFRREAWQAAANLGALHVTRPSVEPDYRPAALLANPFVDFRAGPYFDAEAELGTPAASPVQIASSPEEARIVADAELITIHQVVLRPITGEEVLGARPVTGLVSGGRARGQGPCVRFEPAAVTSPGTPAGFQLTVPAGGLLLRTGDGPAVVGLRRFAVHFRQVGTLPPFGSGTMRIGPDRARQPWQVWIRPDERLTACGLRPMS